MDPSYLRYGRRQHNVLTQMLLSVATLFNLHSYWIAAGAIPDGLFDDEPVYRRPTPNSQDYARAALGFLSSDINNLIKATYDLAQRHVTEVHECEAMLGLELNKWHIMGPISVYSKLCELNDYMTFYAMLFHLARNQYCRLAAMYGIPRSEMDKFAIEIPEVDTSGHAIWFKQTDMAQAPICSRISFARLVDISDQPNAAQITTIRDICNMIVSRKADFGYTDVLFQIQRLASIRSDVSLPQRTRQKKCG
jgi:hypothetical protein